MDPNTAWAFDETLPVPIQLGGGEGFSVFTKTTDSDGRRIVSLENEELWIGGIDLHLGTTTEWWNDGDLYCKAVTVAPSLVDDEYLFDESGKHFVKAEIDPETGRVKFKNGNNDINRYYPYSETKKIKDGENTKLMHTGNNYSFVAYHTPTLSGTAQTIVNGSRLLRQFQLNTANKTTTTNNMDILWARVDAKPIGNHPEELAADDEANNGYLRGFNARYQRYLAAQHEDRQLTEEDLPMLKFQHVASLIHLFVVAKDDAAEESFNGDVTIDKVKINNKIQYLALDLISGEIIPDPTFVESSNKKQAELVSYYAPNSTYFPDPIHPLANVAQEYSGGFFVMPGARTDEQRITVNFMIQGIEKPGPFEVDLPLPMYEDSVTGETVNGYQPGVEYNYYISIDATEQIVLRTSLDNWDATSGTGQLSGAEDIVIE